MIGSNPPVNSSQIASDDKFWKPLAILIPMTFIVQNIYTKLEAWGSLKPLIDKCSSTLYKGKYLMPLNLPPVSACLPACFLISIR